MKKAKSLKFKMPPRAANFPSIVIEELSDCDHDQQNSNSSLESSLKEKPGLTKFNKLYLQSSQEKEETKENEVATESTKDSLMRNRPFNL